MAKGVGSGCWSETVRAVPLWHMFCLASNNAWSGLGRGRPRIESQGPTSSYCALSHLIHDKVGRAWLVGVVVVLVRGYPNNDKIVCDIQYLRKSCWKYTGLHLNNLNRYLLCTIIVYDYFRAPWAEGDMLVRLHSGVLIHYQGLEEEVDYLKKKKMIRVNFLKRRLI